jgi:hypothetical protein
MTNTIHHNITNAIGRARKRAYRQLIEKVKAGNLTLLCDFYHEDSACEGKAFGRYEHTGEQYCANCAEAIHTKYMESFYG